MRIVSTFSCGMILAAVMMMFLIPADPIECQQPAPKLPAVEPKKEPPKKPQLITKDGKHGLGHIPMTAAQLRKAHRASNDKHGKMLRRLTKATQPTYDARITGTIPPPGDQGQCGDCYAWSGTKVVACANVLAGNAPASQTSPFMLSVQEVQDYSPSFDCNGGEESDVSDWIMKNGCASVTDYPGAGQGAGTQKPISGLKLYYGTSRVFVDPSQTDQGVASTQSIKNAVLAYGYVSVAGAAGGWNDPGSGTITGNDTSIDHAIGIVGWDDTHDNGNNSKGAWIMQNQWNGWGGSCANVTYPSPPPPHNIGYAWVAYGADSLGTDAYVVLAAGPAPPPGPTPVPPGPTPTPTPTTTQTFTATDGTVLTYTPMPVASLAGPFTVTTPKGDSIPFPAGWTAGGSSSKPGNVIDLNCLSAKQQQTFRDLFAEFKAQNDVAPQPMPKKVK